MGLRWCRRDGLGRVLSCGREGVLPEEEPPALYGPSEHEVELIRKSALFLYP